MLERLDFWLMVIPVVLLIWAELRLGRLFGPLAWWVRDRFLMSTMLGNAGEIEVGSSAQATRFEGENEPIEPQQNAEPAPNDTRTGAFEPPAGSLVLSKEECVSVTRMILHRATAEKPSKASTIKAGFGISKGESARYKRASAIYDALFAADLGPEYRPLDAEARPVLSNS